MTKQYQDIDFDKYHTFFLSYYQDTKDYEFNRHLVRPCTATYEEITDTSKNRCFTLESAVLSFDANTPLAQILLECALFGVTLDFVDIYVKNDKKSWIDNDKKLYQQIDLHKEDVLKYLDGIEAPKHYVALNTNKKDALKFLVIDRFKQKDDIEFLKGKYSKDGIVAGFTSHSIAKEYCKKLNKT